MDELVVAYVQMLLKTRGIVNWHALATLNFLFSLVNRFPESKVSYKLAFK